MTLGSSLFPPSQYVSGLAGEASCGALVIIYRQERVDPVFGSTDPTTVIRCDGRSERDQGPSILSIETQCDLGQGSSFEIVLKTPLNLIDEIYDDDWVDIAFYRGPCEWHILRGSIDEVRKMSQATARGTTTTTYMVSGRGFEKIWQNTPMWFETTIGENAGQLDVNEVFLPLQYYDQRDPPRIVYAFLWRFFLHSVALGRNGFNVPPSLSTFIYHDVPNDTYDVDVKPIVSLDPDPDNSFISFDASAYRTDINTRIGDAQNFFYPDCSLWDAAMQWCDPVFCELYTDLLPTGGLQDLYNKENPFADGFPFSQSRMTCVIRDKPFVIGVNDIQNGYAYAQLPGGDQSAWFSLPTFKVPRQYIVAENIGRSGFERYNAFHHSLQTSNSSDPSATGNTPNWNLEQMRAHGLRRFDAASRYLPYPEGTSGAYFTSRKQQARDWYSTGGVLLQGQLVLGCGMPSLRVGSHFHIVDSTPDRDEHYYVESVSHSYEPGPGIRTQVGVTRGYRGDVGNILKIVNEETTGYTEGRGDSPSNS